MQCTVMATADVHLGMKFAAYGDIQSKLIDARFDALARTVEIANEHHCDMLVVAGDLFDRVRVAADTIERAASIVAGFDGAVAAVLPGNHDYIAPDADTLWSAFSNVAGDRTTVLSRPGHYPLDAFDLPVDLLAAPCDAKHGDENRIGWMSSYTPADTERVVVGVAHGSIDGLTLDSEGRYFPMTRSQLETLPPHLWVIGHTHRSHHIEDSRLVVPGTPEPDGFDFDDEGHAALITLGGGSCEVAFPTTSRHRFVEIELDVDQERSVITQIEPLLTDTSALYRLVLRGSIESGALAEYRNELQRLEDSALYLRIDDTGLRERLTRQQIDSRFPEGSFIHRLLTDLVGDGDHEATSEALRIVEELEK